MVSKWVFNWMNGEKTVVEEIPYHLKRYMANTRAIKNGHFSVLQEMIILLIIPLEQHGYNIPSNILPDISEGRMFANWLKSQGVDMDNILTYAHKYEDGRVFQAKMYPDKYLTAFRGHLAKVWLLEKASTYFQKRDIAALPFLNNMLELNSQYTDEIENKIENSIIYS